MSKPKFLNKTKVSENLYQEAKKYIPLGVGSSVRAMNPYPVFVTEAKGTRIRDVDGNEYIDFAMNYGAQMVGHSHPKVINAIKDQSEKGTLYTFPHQLTTDFAKELTRRFPVEQVRFTNSGTEATMHAIRLARSYTKRDKIIKMEGAYHGAHDYLYVSTPGVKDGLGEVSKPRPVLNSTGIPKSGIKDTLIASFNNLDSVKYLFEKYGREIAGVIVEPIMLNIGFCKPHNSFLSGLKDICQKYGALLIFDEIKTGVKVAWGGACEYYDIRPDIICFAKSIGGGLPVGAFGAREEIMGEIGADMVHAGTYNANPLSMAVGLTTLRDILTRGAYEDIANLNRMLINGYNSIIKRRGVNAHADGVGAVGCVMFSPKPLKDYRDYLRLNTEISSEYWFNMLQQGIIPFPYKPSAIEQWTISVQHTHEDIEKHLAAFDLVASKLTSGS